MQDGIKMKIFFYITLSFLFHTLAIGLGFYSSVFSHQPLSVERGRGNVEMEIVILGENREGKEEEIKTGSQNKILAKEFQAKDIKTSGLSHPAFLEKDFLENEPEPVLSSRTPEISQKAEARFLVVPVSLQMGALALSDEKQFSHPAPPYPRMAILKGWEGEAAVKIFVSEAGKVSNIQLLQSSSHGVLDEAVLKTLSKWEFQEGSTREIEVPVRFVLKTRRSEC